MDDRRKSADERILNALEKLIPLTESGIPLREQQIEQVPDDQPKYRNFLKRELAQAKEQPHRMKHDYEVLKRGATGHPTRRTPAEARWSRSASRF
jgi:hypothetical protein